MCVLTATWALVLRLVLVLVRVCTVTTGGVRSSIALDDLDAVCRARAATSMRQRRRASGSEPRWLVDLVRSQRRGRLDEFMLHDDVASVVSQ